MMKYADQYEGVGIDYIIYWESYSEVVGKTLPEIKDKMATRMRVQTYIAH